MNATHYDLAVTFDLARSTLIGKAVFHNPAIQQTSIALGNLMVKRITVARRELPVPSGESIITGGTPGQVEIENSMQYKEDEDSLESPDAILLQGDWYPAVKGMQVYHLTATLPEGFDSVSEAESISKNEIGDGSRFEFDFPRPLPAADGITLVASRQFTVRKSRQGAVEIATYLLSAHAGRAAVYLTETKRYLRRFEALLGPYPFKRLTIVESPEGGCLSMPIYILLRPAEFGIDDIVETALGHEIARQWFGNLRIQIMATEIGRKGWPSILLLMPMRKLFGDFPLPDSEFSVTIRAHPRNPEQVVAVVTADSGIEWKSDALWR